MSLACAIVISRYGSYWHHRYYSAQPDEPVAWNPTEKGRPGVIGTTGFALLRARARELLVKDGGLSEPQAMAKAAEMYPDLVESHQAEIRGAVSQ
jgi:hypothetical protein